MIKAISAILVLIAMLIACNVGMIFPNIPEVKADKWFWYLLWSSFAVSLRGNWTNSEGHVESGVWFLATGFCVVMLIAEVFDEPSRKLPWMYILASLILMYYAVEWLKSNVKNKNPD